MHSVLLSMHLVFLYGNGLLSVILAFHFFFCRNFAFFLLPQVFPVVAYRCISHIFVVYFRTAPPSTFPVLTVRFISLSSTG